MRLPSQGRIQGGALGAEAPPPPLQPSLHTQHMETRQAPPLSQKHMILHKHQTEETCLRLYKSISGALSTSATRWSRSRQFGGRGFAKKKKKKGGGGRRGLINFEAR